MESGHVPVLEGEVLNALNLKPDHNVIDCTVGAGGHSEKILQQTGPSGQLLGLDMDPLALNLAAKRLRPFKTRVRLVNCNFDQLTTVIAEEEFSPVHGILADLGVSSMQLDQAERGFSFQTNGPLDMRLGPGAAQSAEELINSLDENSLADIIYQYGEERKSRRIARAIVNRRPLYTTQELAEVVSRAVGGRRGRRIHPATRTFQAIRIAVNDELGALERFLPQAINLLAPGGRLAVISFHSLEDRIVKHTFRRLASSGDAEQGLPSQPPRQTPKVEVLTKKPITATDLENQANPRARSAKLRVVAIQGNE